MQISRTKNSIRNGFWGIANKFVVLFLPFLVRTVLIKKLGEQYLGLTGLFTAVLSVLSLAESGFGTAIVYSMYKPIAEDDKKSVCALLAYYRHVYHVVGMIVLVAGICVMPFLPRLIKGDYPADVNLYVLYVIYLANTVVSYFLFAYKSSIFAAFQRNDVTSKINSVINILKCIVQIVVVFACNNYMAYVVMVPVATLATNIATHVCSTRLFPNIIPFGKITQDDRKAIKKQVAGLFVSRIATITKNSVDNIFISSFIGLSALAVFSNYYYIISTVYGFLDILCVSMYAGIGNSVASCSQEKNFSDFKRFTFIFSWLVGLCAVLILCLVQPFMRLWVGERLVFPLPTAILFVLYFYAVTINDIQYQYYNANGLWWHGRVKSIVEVVVNIGLNFILLHFLGINGIIIATVVSTLFVGDTWGGLILFKNYFTEHKYREYGCLVAKNIFMTVLAGIICYWVGQCIHVSTVFVLPLIFTFVFVLCNAIFLLFCFRSPLFNEASNYIKNIMTTFISNKKK